MKLAFKDTTGSESDDDARRGVYFTRTPDILPVLKVLRDHSADLELRFSGVDSAYRGRVLDLEGQQFLLEDIRPREGLSHLRKGTRFTFSARVEDLYICGEDCRVTGVESERGLPYYRAELPKRLLRHRRRRHARITLPPRVQPDEGIVRVIRANADHPQLHGRIIDVSVGGCRVAFPGAVMPALQAEDNFPFCELRISSSLEFTTAAVVRHCAWDPAQRTTTCGLEFADMTITDRRRLEHYVSQLATRAQKT